MNPGQGFSPGLRTEADLLGKLHADLSRLERDPGDDFAAWDFIVTADHMRDWNEPKLSAEEDPLLLLIQELANRAKHFRRSRAPGQVNQVGARGAFDPRAFDPDVFATVRLEVDYGDPPTTESAVDLARRVLRWWTDKLAV